MNPKARILDVYGAFGREAGGWIAIADLIEMLALFEVEPQVVRSAASRMKRSDLLISRKVGGAAGYALSDVALEVFTDGDTRIFHPVEPESELADPRWVVAVFSVPETERHRRYLIRSRLTRLGFGHGPAASWFAPVAILADTERMLRRTGLERYVTLWTAEYVGFSELSSLVSAAWDLDAVQSRYDDYLARFQPVAERWSRTDAGDEAAFVGYLENLAAWRPLPYLDPGLPAHVTPDGWSGRPARQLFLELEQRLRPQAMQHFRSVTEQQM